MKQRLVETEEPNTLRQTNLYIPENLFIRAKIAVAKLGKGATFQKLVAEGLELRLAQLEKQS